MFKKITTYLPLVLLCVVAIASLSFSESKLLTQQCSDVCVVIEKEKAHSPFINEHDVFSNLKINRNMMIGKNIQEINIDELEKTMEANPLVLACEVYFSLNNTLNIKIQQRNPIFRVSSLGGNYYIDECANMMPLSKHASSRVLVVSGNLKDKYKPNVNIKDSSVSKILKDVYSLVKIIQNDSVFKAMIEQIYVTVDNEFVFGTKIGPSKIEFGTIHEMETKFRHLKAFYMSEKVRENWKSYKSISLKYKNQIICTKDK